MKNELENYRKQINSIDKQIFELLEKRFEIVEKIGDYKKQNFLPVRNIEREKELVEKMIAQTVLDKQFVKKMYELIFSYSYKIEE